MGVGQVGKAGEKSTFALTSVIGKQIMSEFRQDAATEIQEKSPDFGHESAATAGCAGAMARAPRSQRSSNT